MKLKAHTTLLAAAQILATQAVMTDTQAAYVAAHTAP